jgi:hypothetical protein
VKAGGAGVLGHRGPRPKVLQRFGMFSAKVRPNQESS